MGMSCVYRCVQLACFVVPRELVVLISVYLVSICCATVSRGLDDHDRPSASSSQREGPSACVASARGARKSSVAFGEELEAEGKCNRRDAGYVQASPRALQEDHRLGDGVHEGVHVASQ